MEKSTHELKIKVKTKYETRFLELAYLLVLFVFVIIKNQLDTVALWVQIIAAIMWLFLFIAYVNETLNFYTNRHLNGGTEWYHLKFVFHPDCSTYSVYLGGKLLQADIPDPTTWL